jgi:recombination protein RecA
MAKKEKESKELVGDSLLSKVIDSVISKTNAEFKDDDLEIASKQDYVSKLEWLSSGIYAVNYTLTGNAFRGIPFGKTVSLIGDSNSGKSLLSQYFIKETQRIGGMAVLFDIERGIEKTQLKKIGIDTDTLLISKSKTLEDMFEKAIFMIKMIRDTYKQKIPLTIVVDSLSMACSKHELKEGFDKTDMKRAQNIKKGLRMMNSIVSDERVCFIVINHLIANVGVMYGPKKVTAGGSGVEYIPSIVIEVSKGAQILDKDEKPIGVESSIKVKKTRLHIPFVKSKLEIYFNKGFESTTGLFPILEQTGVIKSVSDKGWYSFYNDDSKKYRESEIIEMIKQNPDEYLKKLDTKIEVSATEIIKED